MMKQWLNIRHHLTYKWQHQVSILKSLIRLLQGLNPQDSDFQLSQNGIRATHSAISPGPSGGKDHFMSDNSSATE